MTRYAVEHNLEPDELVASLAAVACDAGLADDLIDQITKSARRVEVAMPREAYMLAMVRSLQDKYAAAVDALGEHLVLWLDAIFPHRSRWRLLNKAMRGIQLTADQIEELRLLIKAHFRPAGIAIGGGVYRIPDTILDRWRAEGIIVPGISIPEIADAYNAARLVGVIEEATTFEAMKHLAERLPTTAVQRHAVEWLEQHATRYMVGFGDKLGTQAVDGALSLNQKLARRMLVQYQQGELKIHPVADGPTDRVVEGWRGLARQLYKTFKSTDANRDWLRVANSEVRLSFNVGRLHTYAEQGVRQIYYLVRPDACEECRAVYLNEDGSPKIFTVEEILNNVDATGGLNIGRKASKIGDSRLGWVPTGLLHPFCFPGHVRVEGAIVAGLEASYAGPLVTIDTETGHRLAVTPKHPVAALRGMIAAGSLCEGEYVLSQTLRVGHEAFRAVQNQHGPAAIHECVQALRTRGAAALKIGGLDLHGDARWTQGQVYVVGADTESWSGRHAGTHQGLGDIQNMAAEVDEALGIGGCSSNALGHGLSAPANGLVQSIQSGILHRCGHARPLQSLGFRTPANTYPSGDDPARNCVSGVAGSSAQGQHGLAIDIAPDYVGRWRGKGTSAASDPRMGAYGPVLSEEAGQDAVAHAKFLDELVQWRPGFIAPDRITKIRVTEHRGHVYDVQSMTGWILAEGIITSNCRCLPMPLVRGQKPLMTMAS